MPDTIAVKVDGSISSVLKTGFKTAFYTTSHLSGSKVLIGDNLSSHFNASVIRLAQQRDVKFICLPSNATHLIQPLDVAFYAWKRSNASMSQALSKDAFLGLLKRLNQQLQTESGKNENFVSGFRATGLYPYNPNNILNKLPSADNETEEENGQRTAAALSDAVISILSTMRGGKNGEPLAKKRRTRINVTPGKSVSLEDLSASPSPSVTPTPTSVQRQKKQFVRPRPPASNASTSKSSTPCCRSISTASKPQSGKLC